MSITRTGGFTIGIRHGWSDWQKDSGALVRWVKENGFGAIDLGRDGNLTGKAALDAGLRLGSVDLLEWNGMIATDKAHRANAIARNRDYIKACAALGPVNHFIVMLPQTPSLPREENFKYMVESFSALAPVMEQHQARVVIEGWPGPGAQCCTPESYREFFKACPSKSMGINYDPSHLIRMGIDPLRFLREFVDRVYHVHGKDTELMSEGLYEYGNLQAPTFAKEIPFGSRWWRYTIPGHGLTSWTEAFKILKEHGYSGCVSIELEDANFNGTEDTEKQGFNLSRTFLEGC